MRTTETIREMIADDREGYFAAVRQLRENCKRFTEIYKDTSASGATPKETVKQAMKELGKDAVREIVSSLVVSCAYDGRLSEAAKEWAFNSDSAWDEEACRKIGLYSEIHRAHLSQLAEACGSLTAADYREIEGAPAKDRVKKSVNAENQQIFNSLSALESVLYYAKGTSNAHAETVKSVHDLIETAMIMWSRSTGCDNNTADLFKG